MTSLPPSIGSTIVNPSITLRSGGRTIIGRDMAGIRSPFQHPLVAPRHAEILSLSDHAELTDLGPGTSVNGRRLVNETVTLRIGDEIGIGPWLLQFAGDRLVPRTGFHRVDLTAENICVRVGNGKRQRTLLENVSLSFRPGEFVCIIGASGCGKSTLMNVLSGVNAPTSGVVGMNRINLHENFEDVCRNIVLVPQQTILHLQLTVREALTCTARLRLPAGTTNEELTRRVNEVLSLVRLPDHVINVPIGRLSGGQQKRVCLANELISDPGLLLLDEVTSGLDEKSDGEMMKLFSELATQGKTLICITHSLKHVSRYCHLICVLGPGGRVVFVGPPADALAYFGISDLGDLYQILETLPDQYQPESFAQTAFHTRYVAHRLANTATPRQRRVRHSHPNWKAEGLATFRQFRLLLSRQLRCMKQDPAGLIGLCLQTCIVALMLILAFGQFDQSQGPVEIAGIADRDTVTRTSALVNFVFLLSVTSFWFGCNNAARDIVRERAITNQERRFNLRYLSYVGAKLFLHALLSGMQVCVLLTICWKFCTPPGNSQSLLIVLLCLSTAGTGLGLLISALAPTEQVAVTMIPVTIIPQIVLSGAIFRLTEAGRWIARFAVTTWWGKLAADSTIEPDWKRIALANDLVSDGSFPLSMAMILFHGSVFTIATLITMCVLRGQRNQPLKRFVRRLGHVRSLLACSIAGLIFLVGCNTPATTASHEDQQPADASAAEPVDDASHEHQAGTSDPAEDVFDTMNELVLGASNVLNDEIELTPQECEELGAMVHRQICEEYSGQITPSDRLALLAEVLVRQIPESPFRYRFFEVNTDAINAFSHVGGYVYLHRGLLECMETDEERLFVLGHEMAHIELRHVDKAVAPECRARAILGDAAAVVGALHQFAALSYSEQQEFDSDAWSWDHVLKSGYSRDRVLNAVLKLPTPPPRSKNTTWPGRLEDRIEDHFRTHPDCHERAERLRHRG